MEEGLGTSENHDEIGKALFKPDRWFGIWHVLARHAQNDAGALTNVYRACGSWLLIIVLDDVEHCRTRAEPRVQVCLIKERVETYSNTTVPAAAAAAAARSFNLMS